MLTSCFNVVYSLCSSVSGEDGVCMNSFTMVNRRCNGLPNTSFSRFDAFLHGFADSNQDIFKFSVALTLNEVV